MIQKSLTILKKLQNKSGLFSAAQAFSTGYNKAWLRDNIYEAMGLEKHDLQSALKTYHALLDLLLKHEYKINWALKEKPDAAYKYIHARFHPQTFEEFHEEWGNKQNDAIGAFLFRIGQLEKQNISVLRNIDDYRILQKLVFYLGKLEYWRDLDNGMWEENEELHASSIGACLAGLKSVQDLVYVPQKYIDEGQKALDSLLPQESPTKKVDLSLLSLIFPYNIINKKQKQQILKNIEEKLVRKKGVIRYPRDQYYNNGQEAEWTFGFPWLAIIHKKMGNKDKYAYYLQKTLDCMNKNYELPELYYGGTSQHNENTPLGWSQAMYLMAASKE